MKKVPSDKLKELPVIDTEVLPGISPFVFEISRDKMTVGATYSKPYVVLSYPDKPKGNWFSRLRKMSGDITISHYYKRANGNTLNDFYNKTIKNKLAEIERTHDPMTLLRLQKELKVAQTQLEQAIDDDTAYLYLYTYILLQSKSAESLKKLSDDFETRCKAMGLKAIVPYTKIDEAYWSCLPLQSNEVQDYTYTIANSISASSIFPFDDNEMSTFNKNIVIEGINKDTENIISLDYTNRTKVVNRNKFVFGMSGTGKTTYLTSDWLKKFAMADNSQTLKRRIVIFDPENEQEERVKKYGGQVITLSATSDVRINPFHIHSREIVETGADTNFTSEKKDLNAILTNDEIEKLINKQMNILNEFFHLMDNEITSAQLSIVKGQAKLCYERFYEKKNLADMLPEDFPTFSDLEKRLKSLEKSDKRRFEIVENFIYALEDFTTGSRNLFNGATNIDLNSSLISFSLKDLQTQVGIRDLAYLNTFSYLFDDITNNPQIITSVFADEFHFLLKNPFSADFFYQAFKRLRKYNADATVSTQQIDDVMKAPNNVGKAIIGNSFTKLFFGLDEDEATNISSSLKLNLTSKELSFLTSKRQGEALIFHGKKRAKLKIQLTQEEFKILNPGNYQEMYGESVDEEINWYTRTMIS